MKEAKQYCTSRNIVAEDQPMFYETVPSPIEIFPLLLPEKMMTPRIAFVNDASDVSGVV